MIMSPFTRQAGGVGMQAPRLPQPTQDPSGATTSTPQGLGGLSSLMGNPSAANGPGGILQLIQAMKNAQVQNAPQVTASPMTGAMSNGQPGPVGITPGQGGFGGGGMLQSLLQMLGMGGGGGASG
jgi:hypothetical protein